MFGESPETQESAASGTYPIRTVAALTGVNPITLRAWERRYGLIKPKRTPSGQRLYSRDDVALINEVVRQLESGINVSQVKIGAAGAMAPAGAALREAEAAISPPDPWSAPYEAMIAAIGRFDEQAVESIYDEALSVYPMDVVINRLILPLMQELGRRWENGTGSVAEEHFFVVYLRNKLGARLHHRGSPRNGARLIAACLPGERHENGLLLFALAAQERGYRVVLLGADMPLHELAAAANRGRAGAIVLSGATKMVEDAVANGLPELVRDASVPVFVGGRISALMREAIATAGAIPIGEDLRSGLRTIEETLRYG